MMDHNVLKDEISSAKRYRKLQELKMTISGLKRGMPISFTAELDARVTEKLRTFDYPMCKAAKIRVIFSNGLSTTLEQDECHYAMAKGMKLSDYIFSKYISAKDFEIDSSETVGSRNLGVFSDSTLTETESTQSIQQMSPIEMKERVDALLKKVDNLEKLETVFAENIPKMARDLNDLKEKLDLIYKKFLNQFH